MKGRNYDIEVLNRV